MGHGGAGPGAVLQPGKEIQLSETSVPGSFGEAPEGREEVRWLLSGEYRPTEVSVRVEPSLNRAVSYAHALKLVKIEKGTSVSLTDAGAKMAKSILEEWESLKEEAKLLISTQK